MTPPSWLTTWLTGLPAPLIKGAVDEANADLLADVKAAIDAGNTDVLGAVSGLGSAVGSISGSVEQIVGDETAAVVNGIKALLPFPL